MAPSVILEAPHARRLRCASCHRFLGMPGSGTVPCERCRVDYVQRPDGTYERVRR